MPYCSVPSRRADMIPRANDTILWAMRSENTRPIDGAIRSFRNRLSTIPHLRVPGVPGPESFYSGLHDAVNILFSPPRRIDSFPLCRGVTMSQPLPLCRVV